MGKLNIGLVKPMQQLCFLLLIQFIQVDLFGKSIEKPKILPSLPHGNNLESFEELEKRVAKEYNRRHIGFPCDIAQDMQIDDRPEHIRGCPDCQELIKKYDVIAYGTSN